jgi:hypothetical protein
MMKTSCGTSKLAMARPEDSASPLHLRPVLDTDSPPDSDGPPCMNDSTEPEIKATSILPGDCEYEFFVAGGRNHPVGIVCTVHGWTGDITDA